MLSLRGHRFELSYGESTVLNLSSHVKQLGPDLSDIAAWQEFEDIAQYCCEYQVEDLKLSSREPLC